MSTNTPIRKQSVSALLLGRGGEWCYRSTDRGIDWCFDIYGIARADLFRKAPSNAPPRAGMVRRTLDWVRAQHVIGPVRATEHQITVCERPAVLLTSRALAVAVNPVVWEGWSRTGLAPSLTDRGTVVWHGKVRGKQALFGAFLPLHLWPAASTEER